MMTIRTLVVDDDYRVAKIHAAGIDRVPGFTCVGQAHTAAEARQAVAELQPELLLLDIYLPDEDGLAILRGLNSADGTGPDCIVITAARDLDTVRTAMHLGAVYYLVKPFGFPQLRDQLDAYRRWRQQTSGSGDADQATVDALYNLLRGPATKPATTPPLPPDHAEDPRRDPLVTPPDRGQRPRHPTGREPADRAAVPHRTAPTRSGAAAPRIRPRGTAGAPLHLRRRHAVTDQPPRGRRRVVHNQSRFLNERYRPRESTTITRVDVQNPAVDWNPG
jgi:CheY-like chemotaxis protein